MPNSSLPQRKAPDSLPARAQLLNGGDYRRFAGPVKRPPVGELSRMAAFRHIRFGVGVSALKYTVLAVSALIFCGQSGPVFASPMRGKCLLKVDGKTYINGPCDIEISSKGGFTVSSVAGKEVFATIFDPDGNSAEGNWTGTGSGGLAERFEGSLQRHGACWESASAKVCAYR